jgi:chemotaxis protein histidine kinase CheA
MRRLCWFALLFNLLSTFAGLGFSQESATSSSPAPETAAKEVEEKLAEDPVIKDAAPLSDAASGPTDVQTSGDVSKSDSPAVVTSKESSPEVSQESSLESKTETKASSESALSSPAEAAGQTSLESKPKSSEAPAIPSTEANLNGNDAISQSAEVNGAEKANEKANEKVEEKAVEKVEEKVSEKSNEVQPPNQELEQSAPPSSQVYYSPVSRIDMAKQKPVYRDKGDGSAKFGTWMISVGSGKANLTKATYYKEFYGSFANTLDFGVDWFFLRHTYGAAGVGGRFSYYTDKGSRQTQSGGKAPGGATFSVLSNVITLQGVVSPLPWHWIVFKGWAGRQYDTFEDTRDNDVTTAEAASTTNEAPKLLVTKGKRNGTVKGVSVLFDISFLDSRSIKSMKPALGIDSLYIAPFKEYYEQKSVNGLNLTRNLSGVMLVFGSAI